MCMCGKPTRNDEDPKWGTNTRAPELLENDELIYDECGRCSPNVGGIVRIDHHSHHFRLVRNGRRTDLLVRHGAGDERISLGYDHDRIPELLEPMDSDRRYLMLHALYSAHSDAARNARDAESARWRQAAAEKRIKTRKLRNQNRVKVWIEPKERS